MKVPFLIKVTAFVTLLSFSLTSTIAYSDSATILHFIHNQSAYLRASAAANKTLALQMRNLALGHLPNDGMPPLLIPGLSKKAGRSPIIGQSSKHIPVHRSPEFPHAELRDVREVEKVLLHIQEKEDIRTLVYPASGHDSWTILDFLDIFRNLNRVVLVDPLVIPPNFSTHLKNSPLPAVLTNFLRQHYQMKSISAEIDDVFVIKLWQPESWREIDLG